MGPHSPCLPLTLSLVSSSVTPTLLHYTHESSPPHNTRSCCHLVSLASTDCSYLQLSRFSNRLLPDLICQPANHKLSIVLIYQLTRKKNIYLCTVKCTASVCLFYLCFLFLLQQANNSYKNKEVFKHQAVILNQWNSTLNRQVGGGVNHNNVSLGSCPGNDHLRFQPCRLEYFPLHSHRRLILSCFQEPRLTTNFLTH